MRGFIFSINKAKKEDLVVTVLSINSKESYYRFFGARHSIIQIGYFIDFELLSDDSRYLPRLKSVRHIDFPWIMNNHRVDIWRDFIKALDKHLYDKTKVDNFYFELLLKSALILDKQNPKRVVCESYLYLLEYEHRLSSNPICLICQNKIFNQVHKIKAVPGRLECVANLDNNSNIVVDFAHTPDALEQSLIALKKQF